MEESTFVIFCVLSWLPLNYVKNLLSILFITLLLLFNRVACGFRKLRNGGKKGYNLI